MIVTWNEQTESIKLKKGIIPWKPKKHQKLI